jgi:hypothetical protein
LASSESRSSYSTTTGAKGAQSLEDGFAPWERSNFDHEFEMVIGCTGTLSFDAWNFVHLKSGALLVNASSGTADLLREGYVALAETSPSDAIRVIDKDTLHERDIHSDIGFHMMGRDVILANGGFPINFDGRLDRIPPEDIQLTVALMVEAAVQAVTSDKKGLMPLDVYTCARLMAEFGETRGDKGKACRPAMQVQAALAEP